MAMLQPLKMGSINMGRSKRGGRLNAISFLRRNADKYPDKVGFIFDDIPYTYEEVMLTSAGLANDLRERGWAGR